jgi:hypothetical protein
MVILMNFGVMKGWSEGKPDENWDCCFEIAMNRF